MFKLALDIHGVTDTYPYKFIKLANRLLMSGKGSAEVHMLSGPPLEKVMRELNDLKDKYNNGIQFWTHVFSICDYLKEENIHYEIDDEGHFWSAKEDWDKAKGIYCHENDIDIIIDNTEDYYPYCPNGSFLLLKDRYEY